MDTHVARQHIAQMLADRSYDVNFDLVNIPLAEFQTRLAGNDIDLYVEHTTEPDAKVYVHFYSAKAKKLTPPLFERQMAVIASSTTGREGYLGDSTDPRVIIVLPEPPQLNLKNFVKTDKRFKRVELFSLDDLQLNPLKHVLVPKHEIVPKEEEMGVLKFYSVSDRAHLSMSFPRILSSDPIARWLGMRSGQLCRITRVSEQCGRSTVYRVVV